MQKEGPPHGSVYAKTLQSKHQPIALYPCRHLTFNMLEIFTFIYLFLYEEDDKVRATADINNRAKQINMLTT